MAEKNSLREETQPSCGFCGGLMSKNPHPNAGKPPEYLVVGTMYVCIPCTVLSRHKWAERAMDVETKLANLLERVEGELPKLKRRFRGDYNTGYFAAIQAVKSTVEEK